MLAHSIRLMGTLRVPEVLGEQYTSGAADKDARRVHRRFGIDGRKDGEEDVRLIPRGTAQYISPRFTGRSLRRKCIVPDEAGTSGSQD